MRFKLNRMIEVSYLPQVTKTKIKFLFLPKIIDDELRWFEFAKILYGQYEGYEHGFTSEPMPYDYWKAIKFLPYDPVYDCEVYKTTGCAHVDGYLCNMDTCDTINNLKTK